MSQPPYPPPGGSDTGDDRPAGPSQQDPSARPYPGWQAAEGATVPVEQPPYGQAPYGQPPYGQAAYGQPPYGHPPHGQAGAATPPWGQGAAASGKRNKVAIVLAALAAVAVAGLAVALVVWSGSDDDGGDSARGGDSSIPAATSEPEGLGDDPDLDDYAEECHGGDMEACDDLYEESPRSSAYELYGGTCAGRQPNADASKVYCVDAFPPAS